MKMNIQKSRLAALIGLMLMVCMMVAMLAVPASAATFEVAVGFGVVMENKVAANIYELSNADLHDCKTYSELAADLGYALDRKYQSAIAPDGNAVYLSETVIADYLIIYNEKYPETPITAPEFFQYISKNGIVVYKVPAYGCADKVFSTNYAKYTYTTTGKFVDSLEESSLSGVLNQIIDLLPIVIPVLIGFIGLNKAIKFIIGVLHSA